MISRNWATNGHTGAVEKVYQRMERLAPLSADNLG